MFDRVFRGCLIALMAASAGASSQSVLPGGGMTRLVAVAFFLFALFMYRDSCMKMGADPRRPLAQGKHVIIYLKVWRFEYHMVTERHVDYGHYERRYAEVSKEKLERAIELGDTLVVNSRFPLYDVESRNQSAGAKG